MNNGESLLAANCLLVLCNRLVLMLGRQIERRLDTFKSEGGFTEGLTAERLAYRTQQSVQTDAPTCPLCGKPMIKRMAKKGRSLSGKVTFIYNGSDELQAQIVNPFPRD